MFNEIWKWSITNRDGIVAGIISSIIVVSLQTTSKSLAITLSYIITFRWQLLRFLPFKSKTPIYVISGSIPSAISPTSTSSTSLIMGPDATASNLIIRTLEEVFPNIGIKHFYCTSQQGIYLDENFISVGGPIFNTLSKALLDYHLDIFFDSNDILNVYGEKYEKNQPLNTDYGFILRTRNPFSPTKTALLVAGCGSHGVLAASYLLSKNRLFPKLRGDFLQKLSLIDRIQNKDFVAVLSCVMLDNNVANIKIIKIKIL